MVRPSIQASVALALALLFVLPLPADDRADLLKATRESLAQFDQGNPGWKVRMKALVELAKRGPVVVPALTEALNKGSPTVREFAAQALLLFAEPGLRPALVEALQHPKSGVRIHALQALSMLGRPELSAQLQTALEKDKSFYGVRPLLAAALIREDRPNPAELRKSLADYDLRNLDSARLGEMAPDFTLKDFSGKAVSLSQFRGKQTVVLRFILFDF